ncbi:MAG TPA: RNB domain-containing ribonuclease [Casimicrobiaceae bacterium]|nr:RNB domain-containing ribonuclease [Casimicrobiaceae bacterium]
MAPLLRSATDELRTIAKRVMRERGLLPEFSRAVRDEASAMAGPATASSASIRDLRGLAWASIDNDDSRDLDQLTVAKARPDGEVTIFVAVADVDALVAAGSAIDAHARVNTTSVYTAAQVFPMLPEKLSTDLTSLAEDTDRLAVVVEMTVAADGAMPASDLYRAQVRNRAKLAYNGVSAWLEGNAPAPPKLAAVNGLDANLRLQDRVAQALKRVRHRRGALCLETLEARAVFTEDGVLTDLRPDVKNRARELIEDFMIAANGVTARFLARSGYASLRRVLRSPERWARIVALAESLGEHLPETPDAVALDAFLTKRSDAEPATFADLSLTVVKLLGKGEYVLERPGERGAGHFGLAVRDYTHATAPNRRFPDLVVQRLLKAALDGDRTPYPDDELAALARHCTEQEDNAAKVERHVRKSAAALLLERRIGERFDGIVTGASEKGTWVRIASPMVEGRVVRGFEGLDVGDRVEVELVHTDASRGYIDFARVKEKT